MLFAVAVQIDDFDAGKDAEQLVTHQAKRGVIEIAVIGHKTDDAGSCLFDMPLGEADEFDVVVVQPGFSLAELTGRWPARSREFRRRHAPGEAIQSLVVRGEAGERRVAEEDGDFGFWILDFGLSG